MVTEKEIKDWYNKWHLSKGENAWRPFEAYLRFLDYLGVEAGRRLLDVGCGTGYLLKAAEQRGLETYGIDISEEGVKIARMISPNSTIAVGHGKELRFPDNFFDYITCLGTLEHFLDIKKGIKEMVRVGKDDASFCIMVPNINYIFWKFRGSKGTAQRDINENLFTLKQWREILENNGMVICKIYPDIWIIRKIKIFSTFNPLGILNNIILKLIRLMLPLNYTYQLVFICKTRTS